MPELHALRGKHVEIKEQRLENRSQVLPEANGDALEIIAKIEPRSAGEFGLKVRRSHDGSRAVLIRFDSHSLEVDGTEVPFELGRDRHLLILHVFMDKSVIEVFVNEGWPCVTRVIHAKPTDLGLERFAHRGAALFKRIDVWQMNPIWPA